MNSLYELIKNEELIEAPAKTERYGIWYQFVIGIGDNEVAYLTLTDDALKELKEMSNKTVKPEWSNFEEYKEWEVEYNRRNSEID